MNLFAQLLHLEPQTTVKNWMFGETTISYVEIGNHPIETTIYKWLALGFQARFVDFFCLGLPLQGLPGG